MGVNCIIDEGGMTRLIICNLITASPLLVHPGYSLADYDVMSQSVKDQLRHSLVRHEYETTPTATHNLPTKQQIINMLAPQGHWITSCPELQVCHDKWNGLCNIITPSPIFYQ